VIARFDRKADHWVLWKNLEIQVVVQRKANWPARYGGHVVVEQKRGTNTPYYGGYSLFGKMSVVAAAVQKALEEQKLAPHTNIQSNDNWAFRNPDGSFREVEEGQRHRNLHVHVYGRDPKDGSWGDPIRQANWREQHVEKKYWGQIWTENQLQRIAAFLELEVPIALN